MGLGSGGLSLCRLNAGGAHDIGLEVMEDWLGWTMAHLRPARMATMKERSLGRGQRL